MTATPGKAPKKVKEKKQTPAERQALMQYNHMMYGPTAKEVRPAAKKVNFGASYLTHPKFLSLMTAFAKGTHYKFDVTDKAKTYTISTDGAHVSFDGKVLFYSRPMNRYEDHLLLDRAVAVQYQTVDALVHLVFAVLRHFPDLGASKLVYLNHQFYHGNDTLETGVAEQGSNLLLGSYRHSKVSDKPKTYGA
jgi:hypothetical protein